MTWKQKHQAPNHPDPNNPTLFQQMCIWVPFSVDLRVSRSAERSRARLARLGAMGNSAYWELLPHSESLPPMSPLCSQTWQFFPPGAPFPLYLTTWTESSCPILAEMPGYLLFFNGKQWFWPVTRYFYCVSGCLNPCQPAGQTLCRSILLFAFSVNHF